MKTVRKQKVAGMALGLSAALIAGVLAGCSETPPPQPEASTSVSHEKGVAGGTVVNTLKMSVKVVALNQDTRTLTLMDSDGEEFNVKAGPNVVNFDQIERGDMVNVTMTKEMVVGVVDSDESVPQGSADVIALAPEGAKPGGVAIGTHIVTATVAAIDSKARTATLEFSNGETKVFPVREDIDLSKYSVGQKVVFQVTEMVAVNVEERE